MSTNPNKCPVQFRCRPIRSSSCATQSKPLTLSMVRPADLLDTLQQDKPKLHLNIPRKVIVNHDEGPKIQQNKSDIIRCENGKQQQSSYSRKYNNGKSYTKKISLNSLNSDQTMKQAHLQQNFLDKIQSNHNHKTNQNKSFRNNKLKIGDHQSKATMKKHNIVNLRIRSNKYEQQEIKTMLMELADGHQEMMAMLKSIINKKEKDEREGKEGVMSRMEREDGEFMEGYGMDQGRNSSQRKKSNKTQQQKQRLQINRAYNQIIFSSLQCHQLPDPKISQSLSLPPPPQLQSQQSSQLRESSTIRSNKLPSHIANIIVQVIKQNMNFNPILSLQMDLRQIISRRFQAYRLNYNYVLDRLIGFDQDMVEWGKMGEMLVDVPFLLDQEQVEIVRKTLVGASGYGVNKDKQKDYSSPLINNAYPPLSLSTLAQKLRYFVQDRQLFDQNIQKLKILQLKSILTTKRQQIQQKCIHIANSQDTITLQALQSLLKQFRLEEIEIEIIINKLCIESKSTMEIRYGLLSQSKWVEALGN